MQQKPMHNNQQKHDSLTRSFTFGTIVLSLSTIAVLAKLFGFAEKVIIARFFGTGDRADVYFASMGIVLSIVWLVRERLKLFIVLGLLVLLPWLGIYSLAVVLGFGAIGCLLVHLYFIPEHRFLLKPQASSNKEVHFSKMLVLMGPLVVGVVFSHISGLVDNLLASMLPEGQLSYLGYSKKVVDAILLIGPVALVTVVYSQLSHLASAKQYEKFTDLLGKAFRLLVYVSVPAGCVLMGLKEPVIRFLFERGRFGPASTIGTSQAFMIYALGLTTFSLETLLVHSFFALSDTRTPVKWGVICVLLDIALAILFLKPLQCRGIAAAFVISKTIKIAILTGILNKRLKGLFSPQIVVFISKLAVTTAAVWVVLQLLLAVDNPDSFFFATVADLILPAGGALLTFIVSSYLLRIEEFKIFLSLLRYRKKALGKLSRQAK